MRARRKHLIQQVMDQHHRIMGEDDIKTTVFKKHLEQFSDEEIEDELIILKKS